jgi:hypothetical protein
VRAHARSLPTRTIASRQVVDIETPRVRPRAGRQAGPLIPSTPVILSLCWPLSGSPVTMDECIDSSEPPVTHLHVVNFVPAVIARAIQDREQTLAGSAA